MSAQMKKEWNFIQLLTETSQAQRLALLKTLSSTQLAVLCEITLNLLQGNIEVSPAVIQYLKKHRSFLRKLASKDIPQEKKKRAIRVKHKVITYLLQSVKPVLEAYVTS